MKKIILICIFILFVFVILFFTFVYNTKSENNIVNNEILSDIPIVVEKNDLKDVDIVPNKIINTEPKKNFIPKNIDLNSKEVVIKKFKDKKKVVKNDISNFVEVSDKEIVADDIKKDQCILNVTYKKSDLSVCDFVKSECADLECDKYDCLEYLNGWFKVAYYGSFVGSGDKELISRSGENIVIANLECENKSLENYENKLFLDLIKN